MTELPIGDPRRVADLAIGARAALDEMQRVDRGREGVAQLVGEHGQELVLTGVGLLGGGQLLDLAAEVIVRGLQLFGQRQ